MKPLILALSAVLLLSVFVPDADAFRFRRRGVNVNVFGGGVVANVAAVPAVNVQVQRVGLFGLRRRVNVNVLGGGVVASPVAVSSFGFAPAIQSVPVVQTINGFSTLSVPTLNVPHFGVSSFGVTSFGSPGVVIQSGGCGAFFP